MNRRLISFVVSLSLLLAASTPAAASGADEHGFSALEGKLRVGGYAAATLKLLDQAEHGSGGRHNRQLAIEDLSLFMTYDIAPAWRAFMEGEVEDALIVDEDGPDTSANSFSLERMYMEYEPSEHLRVRAGKLLTPVGIWNKIHAAPLVWTATRPLTTQYFYDTGTTGLQVDAPWHSGDLDFVITAFGQATDHLDDPHDLQRQRKAWGTRAAVGGNERWFAGASYLRFDDLSDDRWETTVGADAIYEGDRWELSAEFAHNRPDGPGPVTWAGYLQAVFNAGAGFHPVFRYEHVVLGALTRDPLVFGIAYRSSGGSLFKLEGRVGASGLGAGGNGVLLSWARLF